MNAKKASVESPTPGRLVQVRIAASEWRPAIVVRAWPENRVNVQVCLDGRNDQRHGFSANECENGWAWRTSVPEESSAPEVLVAWRWPPRAS